MHGDSVTILCSPERWETPISNAIPGVWGNILTFIGGSRSCIGYRFALVECVSLISAANF